MNIISLQFALFMALVIPANWMLRGQHNRYLLFLLLASYIFYGSFSLVFLGVLLLFSLSTWFFAMVLAEVKRTAFRRCCLALYAALSLGGLGYFKYAEMLHLLADALARQLGLPGPGAMPEIIAPVGLSFFTFQGMAYAIDVYRGKIRAKSELLPVLCYVAFFPTILSGPILRAEPFFPQLGQGPSEKVDFSRAFYLLLRGLTKKVVISGYLSEHIVRQTFSAPWEYSSAAVAVGVVSYAAQIYCDFSGYSDLAQGVALLLGFEIPDNFRAPYSARNLRQFWHRWHITFSSWLSDYLYKPLGGNRKGQARKYLNLLITLALGGLWHGAALKYLVWGLIHGLGLCFVHLTGGDKPRPGDAPGGARAALGLGCARAATFAYVCLAWIFFGADDIPAALAVIGRILAFDPAGTGAPAACPLLVAAVVAAQMVRPLGADFFARFFCRLPLAVQGLSLGLAGTMALRLGPDGVPPFIYFSF